MLIVPIDIQTEREQREKQYFVELSKRRVYLRFVPHIVAEGGLTALRFGTQQYGIVCTHCRDEIRDDWVQVNLQSLCRPSCR